MNLRSVLFALGWPEPRYDATEASGAGGEILRAASGCSGGIPTIPRCASCRHSFVQAAGSKCHRCDPAQLAEVRRPSAWERRRWRIVVHPEIRKALRRLSSVERDANVTEFKRRAK